MALALSANKCNKQEPQTDPNELQPEVSEEMVRLGTRLQKLERAVIIYHNDEYLDSDYQIMYNLCADTWCGYTAPTLSDGRNAGWDVNDAWGRRMFVVKYKYLDHYLAFRELAIKHGYSDELALAEILKVASMHQVTDYYGPVPYTLFSGSEAYEMDPYANPYDPQDRIYAHFFSELDDAVARLEVLAQTGEKVMDRFDLVYGGDPVKWLQFANSLRLRLAMRIRYADAAMAKTQAEKAVQSPFGLITGNDDNAVMYEPGVWHPIYIINVNFNDADTQMGASLDCYLNGYQDPRRFSFARPAADGEFHGVRPGISPQAWTPYKNSAKKVSAPKADYYDICWMNAAEVAFLRAEGALMGWNMGGGAQGFYEEGIRLSFDEWDVASQAESYIKNRTLVPAPFVDVVGSASAPAPSDITIAWDERDSFERKLERLAVQKWLALFPNGAEAWADHRRLHYPRLVPPAVNWAEGVVDTNQGIRRVPYPLVEMSSHEYAYNRGLDYLGGPDNPATRLWWDKKPF